MANGSFYNYVKGTSESNYFGLYCEYSYKQYIDGNYTDVTVDVYIKYYSLNVYSRSGTININGTNTNFTSPSINNYPNGYGKTKIGSATTRVNHNSDGTKKGVSLSVSWNVELTYSGTWYSSLSASKTIDLPTIPRASSISSAGNVTLGNACSVKWTPASSSFKYKLTFSLGSWSATTDFISPNTTSAYTYTGYTIPSNTTLLGQIPNSATGTMSVKLSTYDSSGSQIGSTSAAKNFTVTVPSSVKPTVGTISIDPADFNGQNIFIHGKNKLTVNVSGCSAGTGSSIKSYTISGPGISYVGTNTSATSSVAITASETSDTTLTYTVTVTDNRNRSTSKTGTITCYACRKPYFTSFNAYRVKTSTSTTADDSGTYIRYAYNVAFSSVNSTNDVTVTLKYKTGTGSWTSVASDLTDSKLTSGGKIIGTFDALQTYTVRAEITDNYGGSSYSSEITIFGASRILNIRPDGSGIAFGKMADTNNLFESKWPAKFNDSVTVPDNGGPVLNGYSVGTLGPGTVITSNSNLNDYITSGVYYSGDATVSGTLINTPHTGSGFKLVVEYLGASSYLRQVVIPRIYSCKYYIRYYASGTWNSWQGFSADGNTSYLPLSGGTLTGKLTLDDSLWYGTNNTAGLDCQNSDIIGVNAIYFQDASDSAGEAINFYRGSGVWDTLYAASGALRFHPNRSTGTNLDGYTVLNNNNFRRGTCTLYTNGSGTTVNFSSAMSGAPTIMLTPLTSVTGALPAKVLSRSASGFTAIIGGDAIAADTGVGFMYLAVYN